MLRGGTERAYSALAFNGPGDTLASVGAWPDFLLTLWDWRAGSIVLRAKAFSQDVFAVAFSPYFAGQLTTCGQGHIRFWRMASTFTGLKLQGALGKFGNVELSDVAAFAELPDGKVLSSSETGELLLWDGGLVKAVLGRKGGAPCHEGPVEVLRHLPAPGLLLSAGADGFVRLWDFNQASTWDAGRRAGGERLCLTQGRRPARCAAASVWPSPHGAARPQVNEAEPSGDASLRCELAPVAELGVAPGRHLVALLTDTGAGAASQGQRPQQEQEEEGRRWLALERGGALHEVLLPPAGPAGRRMVQRGQGPAGQHQEQRALLSWHTRVTRSSRTRPHLCLPTPSRGRLRRAPAAALGRGSAAGAGAGPRRHRGLRAVQPRTTAAAGRAQRRTAGRVAQRHATGGLRGAAGAAARGGRGLCRRRAAPSGPLRGCWWSWCWQWRGGAPGRRGAGTAGRRQAAQGAGGGAGGRGGWSAAGQRGWGGGGGAARQGLTKEQPMALPYAWSPTPCPLPPGEDGTLFFFDVSISPHAHAAAPPAPGTPNCGALVPRAFVRLPTAAGAARCCVWEAEGGAVLVGTDRGRLLRVPLPPADLDTAHSFEWAAAPLEEWAFAVPRPKRAQRKADAHDGAAQGAAEGAAGEGADTASKVRPRGGGEQGRSARVPPWGSSCCL